MSEAPQPLSRPLSALEVAVGAAVVIGHNVFRILPNEVPILFVLAHQIGNTWDSLPLGRAYPD